MQDSIIVYRNPLEKAVWEGTLGGASTFPIIAGVVVFFAVLLVIIGLNDKYVAYRYRSAVQNVSLWVSAAAGMFTVWYFWV